MFLFSWQHPDPDSAAFEESYNGAALDNVAMFPDDSLLEGATDDGSMAGPAYLAWLRSGLPPTANIESISGGSSGSSGGTNSNPVCAIRPWASGPYFKPNALRYLDSVPFTHRAPRRWGWKNPKVIYHLEVLFAAYPDAAFVHVVRNPLDLAAAQWEHLQNRALEFATLQGGYEAASEVANERCTIASATAAALAQAKRKIPPPTGAATSTSTAAARQLLPLSKVSSSTACALSKSALHKMGTCKGTGGGRGKAAIAACASDKPPSSGSGPATNARTAPAAAAAAAAATAVREPKPTPWQCLQAQLWADINAAARSYGLRCLGGEAFEEYDSSQSSTSNSSSSRSSKTIGSRSGSSSASSSFMQASVMTAHDAGSSAESEEPASTQQSPPPRYLLWRTEDAVGLRSPSDQERLAAALSTFLNVPIASVMRGLEEEKPPVTAPLRPKAAPVAAAAAAAAVSAATAAISAASEPGGMVLPQSLQQPFFRQLPLQQLEPPQQLSSVQRQQQQRRRLGYGKYLAELSLGEATLSSSCAEAAAPGAMASFGYAPESVLLAFAQPKVEQQLELKKETKQPAQEKQPPPAQHSKSQMNMPRLSNEIDTSSKDSDVESSLAPRPVVSLDVVLLVVSLATLLAVAWRRHFARDDVVDVGSG